MSWSREQVTLLIDEYKKYPCLYAVKSTLYKNKHARTRALEATVGGLNRLKPCVTINDIKSKFQGLKTNFIAEHRKFEQSLKSGTGEDDVYEPTLWYYEKMFFILDHCAPRQGTDSISGSSNEDLAPGNNFEASQEDPEDNIQESQYEGSNDTEIFIYEVQEDHTLKSTSNSAQLFPESALPTPSTSRAPTAAVRKKRIENADKVLEQTADAITAMSKVIQERRAKTAATPKKDHFDILADFVASKMKQMDPEIADEVEEQITSLLFKGIRNTKNKITL